MDSICATVRLASGLEGCYQHALGHGIGLLGAAPLALANRTSDTVFQPGNTITFEPGPESWGAVSRISSGLAKTTKR